MCRWDGSQGQLAARVAAVLQTSDLDHTNVRQVIRRIQNETLAEQGLGLRFDDAMLTAAADDWLANKAAQPLQPPPAPLSLQPELQNPVAGQPASHELQGSAAGQSSVSCADVEMAAMVAMPTAADKLQRSLQHLLEHYRAGCESTLQMAELLHKFQVGRWFPVTRNGWALQCGEILLWDAQRTNASSQRASCII